MKGQFKNTVNTAQAVIAALSSPDLGAPGQAQYTVPGNVGDGYEYVGGGMYKPRKAGPTKHCLAGVVIKNVLGARALPVVGSAANGAALIGSTALKGLRNQLRAAGISANRLAEAQAAYDRGGYNAMQNVKSCVAVWLASASAFHNGTAQAAQVNPKLLVH